MMAIAWISELISGVPFFGDWILAAVSIVVGSIVFQKWGNLKIAVIFGLLMYITTGAVMLSFGWIHGASLLTALIILGIMQVIG